MKGTTLAHFSLLSLFHSCDRLYPVLHVKYYDSRSVSHQGPRKGSVTLVKAADFRPGIAIWDINNAEVERTESDGIVGGR